MELPITILVRRLKAVDVKITKEDASFLERVEKAQTMHERMNLEDEMIAAAQEDTRLVEEAYAEFELSRTAQ